MNVADRLGRLEKVLNRWMQPDRTTLVISELRAIGCPVGRDGVVVWVDCTAEQVAAYNQKKAELTRRGFADVFDAMGPIVLICLPHGKEDAVLPRGNCQPAQPPASIGETPSIEGHSPDEVQPNVPIDDQSGLEVLPTVDDLSGLEMLPAMGALRPPWWDGRWQPEAG